MGERAPIIPDLARRPRTGRLPKISAHVSPHNPASARVLAKCGFREEGFLRKHFLKDGQFLDARLFGLLREE